MTSLSIIEERIAKALQNQEQEGLSENAWAKDVAMTAGIRGLTAEMVQAGRTPHAIAQLWLESRLHSMTSQPAPTPRPSAASYPLLPYPQVIFEDMKQHGEGPWTFRFALQTDAARISEQRLSAAIDTVLEHHPVLHMHINEEGMQTFRPDTHSPYLHYSTCVGEGVLTLTFTFNRILGDAASLAILLNNFDRAYQGLPLPADAYLQLLEERQKELHADAYLEHKQWLCHLFDNLACPTYPKPDIAVEEAPMSQSEVFTLPLHFFPSHPNLTFTLATALAIMDYNGTTQAALTWAYLGRETEAEQHIVGSLHRDVPFVVTRTPSTTSLLEQARQQIEQGILHSKYPYTFLSERRDVWQHAVNVLVQPPFTPSIDGAPWQLHDAGQADTSAPSYCFMDVEISEQPQALTIRYSSAYYATASIRRFAELIIQHALNLSQT